MASTMVKLGNILSFLSGVCASLVSVFSKLTFGEYEIAEVLCRVELIERFVGVFNLNCITIDVPFRVLMFGFVLLCNLVMWALFMFSLSMSSSTVEVTVINSSANFITSGLFGMVFFREAFSITWVVGLFFICSGLVLIHRSQNKEEHEKVE
ncbi:uncharacterized protein LOC101241646 isoform X2 [Hydra vulgaris]|uniref:Uncharacterized protein LOC101241646 isoform X2 n=1 Tax=Hydra vulgaris TaxID=6087 RepID=A0ABM4DPR1_HYDVU